MHMALLALSLLLAAPGLLRADDPTFITPLGVEFE